ncbi:MAG: hypothetical protein R3E91_01345 [Chlamydiales bacterium]
MSRLRQIFLYSLCLSAFQLLGLDYLRLGEDEDPEKKTETLQVEYASSADKNRESSQLGLISPVEVAKSRLPGIQYQQKRPFNFYDPYPYQYYYPRPEYKSHSKSCYWLYTNGIYVYSCQ